jgi:hypothetical protein
MNQKLIDEIKIELSSMKIISKDIKTLIQEVGENQPTNIHKTALGGMAAQFYNGIENILKRILKYNKINLPTGENWHLDLIDKFSDESKEILPLKFNEEMISKFNDYRRFRHYFFHGYSHNLNWDILKSGVEDIQTLLNDFEQVLMKDEI